MTPRAGRRSTGGWLGKMTFWPAGKRDSTRPLPVQVRVRGWIDPATHPLDMASVYRERVKDEGLRRVTEHVRTRLLLADCIAPD